MGRNMEVRIVVQYCKQIGRMSSFGKLCLAFGELRSLRSLPSLQCKLAGRSRALRSKRHAAGTSPMQDG